MSAMADPTRGYAAPSLAPGPSPPRQPERRQITHRGCIRQRGRQAPVTPSSSTRPHKSNAPPKGRRPTTGPCPLDSTYSQLVQPGHAVAGQHTVLTPDYVAPPSAWGIGELNYSPPSSRTASRPPVGTAIVRAPMALRMAARPLLSAFATSQSSQDDSEASRSQPSSAY